VNLRLDHYKIFWVFGSKAFGLIWCRWGSSTSHVDGGWLQLPWNWNGLVKEGGFLLESLSDHHPGRAITVFCTSGSGMCLGGLFLVWDWPTANCPCPGLQKPCLLYLDVFGKRVICSDGVKYQLAGVFPNRSSLSDSELFG
jgi:hypothetical protein